MRNLLVLADFGLVFCRPFRTPGTLYYTEPRTKVRGYCYTVLSGLIPSLIY
jgi:hypothetical protein